MLVGCGLSLASRRQAEVQLWVCLQLRLIPNFVKGSHPVGCLLCFPPARPPPTVMSLERALGFPEGHTPLSRWLWHPLKCSGCNLESKGPAELRQWRRTRISGCRTAGQAAARWCSGAGQPKPQPGTGTTALPAKGLPGPSLRPHLKRGAGPGCSVAAGHRPGGTRLPVVWAGVDAPPPAVGPAVAGVAGPAPDLPRPECGARPPVQPLSPVPPLRLSARLSLSRLVTGALNQSSSSRPASPPADWVDRPELSANPGVRCCLRQRQQLWQLGSTPPAPCACSTAAAPWRQASRGTYHLPCPPQKRGRSLGKEGERGGRSGEGERGESQKSVAL